MQQKQAIKNAVIFDIILSLFNEKGNLDTCAQVTSYSPINPPLIYLIRQPGANKRPQKNPTPKVF